MTETIDDIKKTIWETELMNKPCTCDVAGRCRCGAMKYKEIPIVRYEDLRNMVIRRCKELEKEALALIKKRRFEKDLKQYDDEAFGKIYTKKELMRMFKIKESELR